MVYPFNSSTPETEGFLSLRSAWSTEQVLKNPILGSERKQKTGEDIIEQGGHVPTTARSRTWKMQPHGSDPNVKDR